MKRIIAGATGFIGKHIVKRWLNQGHDVCVVGRSRDKIERVFPKDVQAATWDQLKNKAFTLENFECALNLSGAGIAQKRWSVKRKEDILASRVDATRLMAECCLPYRVPLFNASAIGIYGMQKTGKSGLPPALSEDPDLSSLGEQGFLSRVCVEWERAARPLSDQGVRVVHLRFAVVLDKHGGALKKLAVPFYAFVGGPIRSGDQPFSWITLEDACRAIDFLVPHKDISGPVNVAAPQCVSQRNFAGALGKALKRPSMLPTPGFVLKIIFGQMAEEILLNGQHAHPKKLLDHGFSFTHSSIDQALSDIYRSS